MAKDAQGAAGKRRDTLNHFGRMVLRDLAPGGLTGGAKLPAAWDQTIPAFGELTTELKKRFKRDLNLTERNDWDTEVAQARARVAALDADIARCEREIDAIVYGLFDLTTAERALIEGS